ncbi:MAG: hypothetical protein ACYC55_02910 [Candidatus Geothermincolia bacterium]
MDFDEFVKKNRVLVLPLSSSIDGDMEIFRVLVKYGNAKATFYIPQEYGLDREPTPKEVFRWFASEEDRLEAECEMLQENYTKWAYSHGLEPNGREAASKSNQVERQYRRLYDFLHPIFAQTPDLHSIDGLWED